MLPIVDIQAESADFLKADIKNLMCRIFKEVGNAGADIQDSEFMVRFTSVPPGHTVWNSSESN